MLLEEAAEVRVWTHVLFFVFKICCVARYEGCYEEAGDELFCRWDKEKQFYMATRGNIPGSWLVLNLSHLQGPWNMKPEVLTRSGMLKCMCKAKHVH